MPFSWRRLYVYYSIQTDIIVPVEWILLFHSIQNIMCGVVHTNSLAFANSFSHRLMMTVFMFQCNVMTLITVGLSVTDFRSQNTRAHSDIEFNFADPCKDNVADRNELQCV